MVRGRHRPTLSGPTAWVAIFAIGVAAGRLLAADPLTLIPRDVAGVVVFRNLDLTVNRLTTFLKRAMPAEFAEVDATEIRDEFGDLETALGLEAGTCDFSSPLVLILTKPTFDWRSVVVGFTPKDKQRFSRALSGRAGAFGRLRVHGRQRSVLLRDGWAFTARRSRDLRRVLRVSTERSVAAALSERQQTIYRDNDVFIYLPFGPWRPRVMPALKFGLSRMGAMTTHLTKRDDHDVAGDATRAVFDWFADAVVETLDQMESVTLGGSFDGKSFRITHDHAFTPGGSVATFLASAEHTGQDSWVGLPDRPFLMTMAVDWHSPAFGRTAVDLAQSVFSTESVSRRIAPEERRRLVKATAAFYDQMRGMNVMIAAPEQFTNPMDVIETYSFVDSAKALRQMRTIADSSCEVLASFLPVSRFHSECKRFGEGDTAYDEYRFDLDRADPMMRRVMIAMYGERFCVRQAAADKHRIVIAMSGCTPEQFVDLLKLTPRKQGLCHNERVRKTLAALPPDPHVVVLFDIGQVFAFFGPRMMALHANTGGPQRVSAVPELPSRPGLIAGWAGVASDHSFSGQACMKADDVIETASRVRDIGKRFRASMRARQAAQSPKPARPRPALGARP